MCLAGSAMEKTDQGSPQTPNRYKLTNLALSLHGKINTRIHRHWNCMQKVLNKSGEEIEEAPGDLRDKTKVSSSET